MDAAPRPAPAAPRDKLYLIVRADLPPGLQLSQAVHAAQAFQAAHPALCAAWMAASNTLVVVGAPDGAALAALRDRAARAGVPRASFCDDDLGLETALALAPGPAARRLCRGLPLALA